MSRAERAEGMRHERVELVGVAPAAEVEMPPVEVLLSIVGIEELELNTGDKTLVLEDIAPRDAFAVLDIAVVVPGGIATVVLDVTKVLLDI